MAIASSSRLFGELDLVGGGLELGGGSFGDGGDVELRRALGLEDLRQRQRVERRRRRRAGRRARRRAAGAATAGGAATGGAATGGATRRGGAAARDGGAASVAAGVGRALALGVELGEHRLRRRVLGVELQDHLAHRDRLEQKAALGVSLGGALELADRLRRIGHLAERLAGALVPIGIVSLPSRRSAGTARRPWRIASSRRPSSPGPSACADRPWPPFAPRPLYCKLDGDATAAATSALRRRRAQPRSGHARRGVHRRRPGRAASQQDAERACGCTTSRRARSSAPPSGAASRPIGAPRSSGSSSGCASSTTCRRSARRRGRAEARSSGGCRARRTRRAPRPAPPSLDD